MRKRHVHGVVLEECPDSETFRVDFTMTLFWWTGRWMDKKCCCVVDCRPNIVNVVKKVVSLNQVLFLTL